MKVAVEKTDPATGKRSYSTVPAEREITILDFMRHTSGLNRPARRGRRVDL